MRRSRWRKKPRAKPPYSITPQMQRHTAGVLADTCGAVGAMYQNPTHRDFQPRVGFAWDLFRNGKTAVRGGFGLFDNLPLIYQFTGMEILAAPFFELGSINKASVLAGTFYAGVPPLAGNPKLFRAAYIENK